MASKSPYGELEKWLGKKYAQDLSNAQPVRDLRHDARDVLYGSMDVLAMMAKLDLARAIKPATTRRNAS